MKTLCATLVLLVGASELMAQQPVPVPPRPPPDTAVRMQPRARADSAVRDTARRDLVQWAPEDSVMQELLAREGYVVTR
ncbi:MAG: hypothetical protein H7Z74_06620, partial [Anaerolineae bacterium]|nr:hypothetical protein [Gemmatimonadaceae bacterium]